MGVIIEENGRWANVAVVRETSCGESCGVCNLCPKREGIARVLNPIGAKAGSLVKIAVPTSSVLIMTFAAYILPIILTFAAYFALGLFFEGAAREIGTVICLVLFVILNYKFGGALFKGERFQSRITEVVGEAEKF